VIEEHIAGDPMNSDIKWVKLTRDEISQHMKDRGVMVSRNIIKKLLKKHHFGVLCPNQPNTTNLVLSA
jgi:hypothetical protein